MAPILGTLLIGLVTKFGGDLFMAAARKIFSASGEARTAGATSFQSALDSARADRSASAESAPSVGSAPATGSTPAASSTNFAALPAATPAAENAGGEPAARAATLRAADVAAAYTKLDSIQTA